MNVYITGWDGFLSSKLRQTTAHNWTQNPSNADVVLLLGSPTFTEKDINKHNGTIMHQYVKEHMSIIDTIDKPVVFGSSTGVDDINLDHSGSTVYNLSKLFLENYIIHHCKKYNILRIGTIISHDTKDITAMKPDRIQPRISRNDFTNIPMHDYYLHVDTFVERTINAINNIDNNIVEYDLVKYSLIDLKRINDSTTAEII